LVRRSTATSCRKASNSAFLEADDRPSKTSQPQSRMKMRYSRRRDADDHDALRLALVIAAAHSPGKLLAPHSHERDDLIDQRETARAQTARAQENGAQRATAMPARAAAGGAGGTCSGSGRLLSRQPPPPQNPCPAIPPAARPMCPSQPMSWLLSASRDFSPRRPGLEPAAASPSPGTGPSAEGCRDMGNVTPGQGEDHGRRPAMGRRSAGTVTGLLTGWPARAATGLRILLTNTSGPSRTSAA
jgi:hypothetical protein